MASVLLFLGILYFFSHFVALAYPKTRVPDVLLLMGIGIVLGPVLHLVKPGDFGQVGSVFTTIALTVMLFESGTTLDLGAVARSARNTLMLTIGSAALTCGLTAVLVFYTSRVSVSWMECFLVGAIICGTSSAVVIPMVRSLRMREEPGTVLILESALTDVICIVLTVGLIGAITSGQMDGTALAGRSLASLGAAAVIGHVGGLVWLWIWEWVRRLPNALFTTLAFAFILYAVTELLGFSGAIAALAFGVSLVNSERIYLARAFKKKAFPGITVEEKNFFGEFVFLLKTFFFLYLGVSMDFGAWDGYMLTLVTVVMLLIYASRALLCRLAFSKGSTTRREASILSVMAPKGLAAAVLAGLPLQAGVPNAQRIQVGVFAIILVSITLTALMVMLHNVPPFSTVARYFLGSFPEELPAPEPAPSETAG